MPDYSFFCPLSHAQECTYIGRGRQATGPLAGAAGRDRASVKHMPQPHHQARPDPQVRPSPLDDNPNPRCDDDDESASSLGLTINSLHSTLLHSTPTNESCLPCRHPAADTRAAYLTSRCVPSHPCSATRRSAICWPQVVRPHSGA